MEVSLEAMEAIAMGPMEDFQPALSSEDGME